MTPEISDPGFVTIISLDMPHLTAVGGTFAFALILIAAKIPPGTRIDRWLRLALFQILTAAGLAGWLLPWQAGYIFIPLSLCDLALLAGIWAMWSPDSRRACHLLYFWGLAGGLQALLTPDLSAHFPDPGWFQFHAHHCGLVLGGVYVASTGRVRPTWRSAGAVWTITNGYAAVAGLINAATGENFGYLSRKPIHPSLLDFFGPWPWYLIAMEAVGTLSIFLLAVALLRPR